MLKASRFGDFRRNTLSWCRRTRISASNAARDRNNPTKAHHINLQRSLIGSEYPPIRGRGQPFEFAVGTRVAWLPGRFRERPLDHIFDLAVHSAVREAIMRVAGNGIPANGQGTPKTRNTPCHTKRTRSAPSYLERGVSSQSSSRPSSSWLSTPARRQGRFGRPF